MNIEELKNKLLNLILDKSFNYSHDPIFKLVSGKLSQYYFDCKPTSLNPLGQYLLGEIFFDKIYSLSMNITAIGGLTLGADPIACAVSYTSYLKNKPIKGFIVRKQSKTHGLKKMIEGGVLKNDNVVIVDDVITTGESTVTAIEEAKKFGLNVIAAFVLIDRQEGGRENIEKLGIKVDSIFTKDKIMKAYNERNSTSII